ncbi:MAG: hypothetical protein KGI28_07145 [Thaumarchaeota archaeon]|nr:hypothetical protein [Nitrososphaerota archaeon]
MKLKTNSTNDLIKMSEGVREEITRDVLETFGIDLSKQELEHHDKTKPVWTQQIRDNKSLKNELDSFLNIVKNNIENLPEMIQFEKDHPSIISGNPSQDSIAYDHEFLWICESHVKKFDKENYLTKKDITKYNSQIQELKDSIRCITIGQSL